MTRPSRQPQRKQGRAWTKLGWPRFHVEDVGGGWRQTATERGPTLTVRIFVAVEELTEVPRAKRARRGRK